MDRTYKLRWSRRAQSDLESIGDYIAADNPAAAASWVSKLLACAAHAEKQPYAGRIVPEFKIAVLREVLLRRYRVVYRICGEVVQVITIFEGRRRFPADVDIDGDP